MKYILTTERLGLREFTTYDTLFIIKLLNSPGWIEFIGERNVKTEEQARAYLDNGPLKSYKEHGFGLSLVETSEDRKPIGMCGISKRTHMEHPDIGFAFLPEFMGKGYAFEIASATLAYAKDTLNLQKIVAFTMPGNSQSIKLIGKIGMKFSELFSLPDSDVKLMLYSINK